jgi:hypothetical protein
MPNSIGYKLFEACREKGCPICRLEQQSVERYLDHHFYENVNSPDWREQLRLSLGFCHEHAWLGVDKRLGDALGYTIIYHDLVNTILNQLKSDRAAQPPRGWTLLLVQIPEQVRETIAKMLTAFTPRKRCPVCECREEATSAVLTVFVEELKTPELTKALQDSEGLCLPHLRQVLEHIRNPVSCELLLAIQRGKLESLRDELAEFIRKNDYQVIQEGFGSEGDAWLRAIGMIAGARKKT